MGHTTELSEQSYETLKAVAHTTGQTPEALLETLIDEASHKWYVYDDLDDFFRSIGATEEEIRDSEAIFQAREQAFQAQQEASNDANL